MPVTQDITATYRGPGRVMRRLLAMGQREDRALAFLMGACLLFFVSSLPALSRKAHIAGTDVTADMSGALFSWLFIAPLGLYAIAGLSHMVLRLLRQPSTWYSARLALFWSLLASTPLILLFGLTVGFVGEGPESTLVGFAWFAAFLWFWLRSLTVAAREGAA